MFLVKLEGGDVLLCIVLKFRLREIWQRWEEHDSMRWPACQEGGEVCKFNRKRHENILLKLQDYSIIGTQ